MKTLPFPVLISGMNGAGKSTLAKHLAKTYHADYVSASLIHQKMIKKRLKIRKTKSVDEGFWETDTAKKGIALRKKDPGMDRKVDHELLAHLKKKKNTVTDARLMPWMFKGKAVRIWMESSIHETARRVAERDHLAISVAKKAIVERFASDQKMFKKLYGIPYGTEFKCFDLILNTEFFTKQETYKMVRAFIETKRKSLSK